MSDGSLEELEKQAEERRKRGRNPGGSRNPRKPPTAAELQAREEERLRREQARQRRQEEEQRSQEKEQRRQEEDGHSPPPDVPGESAKVKRPTSIPFYPNPDNEEYLWGIAQVAAAHRAKVPATAVLRLALRRLQDQMTPEKVVQELSGPVQTAGKMGRPRR